MVSLLMMFVFNINRPGIQGPGESVIFMRTATHTATAHECFPPLDTTRRCRRSCTPVPRGRGGRAEMVGKADLGPKAGLATG